MENDLKNEFEEIEKEICQEIEEDLRFSIEELSEKSLYIPHIKHKWVSRMMKCRYRISLLEEERDEITSFQHKKISENLKYKISEEDLKKVKIQNDKRLKEIAKDLKKEKWLADYLKELCGFLTYTLTKDVSNMIEMQKLETL